MDDIAAALRAQIPGLYRTRREADPIVWLKFCSPFFAWRWYIIEYEEVAGLEIFYGWMVSAIEPAGRFIRTDLASMRAYFGITIERDAHFIPCSLSAVEREKGENQ